MTSVVVAGDDRAMLQRWAKALRADGRDCTLLSPVAFLGGVHAHADICLFDLGPLVGLDDAEILSIERRHEVGPLRHVVGEQLRDHTGSP